MASILNFLLSECVSKCLPGYAWCLKNSGCAGCLVIELSNKVCVFVLDTVFVVPYDATINLLELQRIHKDLRVANEFGTHWRILSR